VGLLYKDGYITQAIKLPESWMAKGINDRKDLVAVARIMREKVIERLLREGVTVEDPQNTYIGATVEIERDVTIHPFTFIKGKTKIAKGCEIGPFAHIEDGEMGGDRDKSQAVPVAAGLKAFQKATIDGRGQKRPSVNRPVHADCPVPGYFTVDLDEPLPAIGDEFRLRNDGVSPGQHLVTDEMVGQDDEAPRLAQPVFRQHLLQGGDSSTRGWHGRRVVAAPLRHLPFPPSTLPVRPHQLMRGEGEEQPVMPRT